MPYLMIENQVRVIPSVDMLAILGASGSRGTDRIGQFGSGTLHAIALLIRKHHNPKICLGKDVYTILLERSTSKTGNGQDFDIHKILLKKQNGGKYPLNLSTAFGEIDWTDLGMGIREFVSNAFDGSMESFGTHQHVSITKVDNDRAKDGTIRVFIPWTYDVEEYHQSLPSRFLMMNSDYQPDQAILPNGNNANVMMYKKGVLVGKVERSGLFHYNIHDLGLKESRNLDIWEAYRGAGNAISLGSLEVIEKYLKMMMSGDENTFESRIESYYLSTEGIKYEQRNKVNDNRSTWLKAWAKVSGNNDTHISESAFVTDTCNNKGIPTLTVSERLYSILKEKGIPVAEDLLSHDEKEGRVILPSTAVVDRSFEMLWSKLEGAGLTYKRSRPTLHCFDKTMTGESLTMGYYKDNGIYIHTDLSAGRTMLLDQTMLEEIAHHVTKATDNSRDFQDYAFRVAATFMAIEPSTVDDLKTLKDTLRTVNLTLGGQPAMVAGWTRDEATLVNVETGESIVIDWRTLHTNHREGLTDY